MPDAAAHSLRDQYDREGYAIARNVIDADLIAEMHAHAEWFVKRNQGKSPSQLHGMFEWEKDPFYLRVVGDDRLLDIAELFLGPNIALFATAYIIKPADNSPVVEWHQDGSYWPLEPMDVCTLWLAVTESTPANGCMRVIPGTQDMDLQTLRTKTDKRNLLGESMDASLVDESKAVDLVLNPGDVSIHHPNIIHGSNANESDNWRLNLVMRLIPTSTRITRTPWSTYVLRGEVVPRVNTYSERPRYVEGEHFPFRGADAWR